jgi:hypothetical protein
MEILIQVILKRINLMAKVFLFLQMETTIKANLRIISLMVKEKFILIITKNT